MKSQSAESRLYFKRRVEIARDGKETEVTYQIGFRIDWKVIPWLKFPDSSGLLRNFLRARHDLSSLRPSQLIMDVMVTFDVEGIVNMQTKKSISQKKAMVLVIAVKPPISHKIHSFRAPPS
jgi:hypothetical protein